MIFVTVGTHHQPFPRLIDALSALPADELVVQYGHSPAPVAARETVAFLPTGELLERLDAADVVVTHAGVGSVLLARRAGHTPVVVPRLKQHGEHVDDHQVELTGALVEHGSAIALWDTGELAAAVASVPPRTAPRAADPDSALARAVREALA